MPSDMVSFQPSFYPSIQDVITFHAITTSSIYSQVNVPVMVCLLLIFVYLFIGAFAFSSWEDNWSLGAALYFCFISLTTIGFGDLVPLKSFLHYADGLAPFLKMLFTMLYIVFGKNLLREAMKKFSN